MLARWEAFGESDHGEVVQSAIILDKVWQGRVAWQGPHHLWMIVSETNPEWIILIVICPDPKVDDEPEWLKPPDRVCYPLSGCPSCVCPKMVIPSKNIYCYRSCGVWDRGHMGSYGISQLHGLHGFIIQHRRSWWSSSASCVASSPKSVGRCRASVPRSPWRRCWKRSNALRRWSTRSCHGTGTVVEMEMLGGFGTSKLNLNVGKSVEIIYIYEVIVWS